MKQYEIRLTYKKYGDDRRVKIPIAYCSTEKETEEFIEALRNVVFEHSDTVDRTVKIEVRRKTFFLKGTKKKYDHYAQKLILPDELLKEDVTPMKALESLDYFYRMRANVKMAFTGVKMCIDGKNLEDDIKENEIVSLNGKKYVTIMLDQLLGTQCRSDGAIGLVPITAKWEEFRKKYGLNEFKKSKKK